MSSGADLFVVCRTCGSEVSTYVTECPYCGNRMRKRAPKLARPGEPQRRPRPSRGGRARARLGRLRPGEMPGIRYDTRPWATIALIVASVAVGVAWQAGAVPLEDLAVIGSPAQEWWRLLTALLAYDNQGYLFCALAATGLFGWLLERRHGRWAPLAVFALAGAGGMAAMAALAPLAVGLGGNGAALGLLGAWVVPDLRERRRGGETDSDLLGVAVIAVALLALPLAAPSANPLAGVAGGAIGLLAGVLLSAVSRER
jgi:membrane associated rhomboid family serine protease